MTAVTGQYFVGLDLGQSRDFTAIAVLERAELMGEWDPVDVRAAEDDRRCGCGTWSGCHWGRRIRRWWTGWWW